MVSGNEHVMVDSLVYISNVFRREHIVFWLNMSRTHKDLQLGILTSLGMTATVCLLWTIPMSFFASLSNASSVRDDRKWLDDLFNEYPRLVPVTEQLGPLLVVVFNALLESILATISWFEGPISSAVIQGKLC